MVIEAVVVCYNYSDFLKHTIAETLQHVDRLVVVTHPSDNATKQLCDRYGVDCVPTEVFHEDGAKFNKARAINLGLSHLKHTGWLIHLDADILLPHRFRHMLDKAKLDKTCIYGADRVNTKSYEHFQEHKHKLVPAFVWRFLVNAISEFPLGARLLHNEYGWAPIGFTQIWHSSTNRKYPIVSGSAEHSDVMFAVQWPREKRILLPEFFVTHLESEGDAPSGVNWNGRKTKHFGPACKENPPKPYTK